MNIYNTRTKQHQQIDKQKHLRLFVCGPTVYDLSHIGHARTYIFFDSFVAYLRSQEYTVHYLQNITDIDDKIITKANQEQTAPHRIAQIYFEEYTKDMERLLVNSVDQYEKATDYIDQIIEQIHTLIDKEYAYQTPSGVYYRTQQFKNYGHLSGQMQDQLTQTDQDAHLYEQDKEHPHDFVIWKISKSGEPEWNSPWGKGRPGWHIEDTAITHSVFKSPQYEIHGGARDLMFPHHEAEIALMESAYGVSPMVDLWIHTGFLNIENEKMSKSLGNFITIHDILESYAPETLRLFFFQHHYRSPINYSEDDLQQALGLQKRMQDFIWILIQNSASVQEQDQEPQNHITQLTQQFYDALNHDFNTPQALAILTQLMAYYNTIKETPAQTVSHSLLSFFKTINPVFHFLPTNINTKAIISTQQNQHRILIQKNTFEAHCEEPDEHLTDLLNKRNQLRQQKQYNQADSMRKTIEQTVGCKIIDQ